jgi:hypothetical protein
MTLRTGIRLLAIAPFVCAGAALLAQVTAVPSLSVRVAPKAVHIAVVAIENQASHTLVNWNLEFAAADGTAARVSAPSKGGVSVQSLDGLIGFLGSGERRRFRFVVPDTFVPKSVRLTYVNSGFESEGDQAIFDEFDRRSSALATSARYWQTVLVQAPTDETALRTYIKTHVDESLRLGIEDPDLTRTGLLNLLQECAPSALARGVRNRQQEYDYRSRFPLHPQPRKVGLVTSARVTLEPATTANEVVAYVKNERDVAADVWEVEVYALPESRSPIMTFTSHGGRDPRVTASSVERPLGAHEVRELRIMSADWEEGVVPLPRAVTTLAVFDDGRFEGSVARRDQLLAERARDAVDIEYWLDPLKLVKNVSAADAVEALRDRLRTRKCQSSSAVHTDHIAAGVATVAWKIQSAPGQKDAILDAAIARLESERNAILGLVNR